MEVVPARSPGSDVALAVPFRRLRFEPGELPDSRNPYKIYVEKHGSAETRRTMKGCLDRMAEIMSPTREPYEYPKDSGETFMWWLLGFEDAAMLRRIFTERGYSPSGINKHLSAFRQVLKTSKRLKLMSAQDYDAAAEIESVKGKRLPGGRNIADKETALMLAVCVRDERPAGIRDAAVIAVLSSTGARRAEVAGMLIECYDSGERALKIIGKGDKEREVYVHDDALAYLDRWLVLLNASEGHMFRPVNRWNQIQQDGHLEPGDIGRIFQLRRIQAGVRKASTHDTRRTFIGKLLDKKVDIVTVQELVGHENPKTTAGYDPRPARGRRAAVDKLHLPRPEDLVRGHGNCAGVPDME